MSTLRAEIVEEISMRLAIEEILVRCPVVLSRPGPCSWPLNFSESIFFNFKGNK